MERCPECKLSRYFLASTSRGDLQAKERARLTMDERGKALFSAQTAKLGLKLRKTRLRRQGTGSLFLIASRPSSQQTYSPSASLYPRFEPTSSISTAIGSYTPSTNLCPARATS